MSQKRKSGVFDRSEDEKSPITTLARDYPGGHVIPLHFHDRDQLVYASRGVMTVRTQSDTWVVPPQRAVWIPADVSRNSGIRFRYERDVIVQNRWRTG
jgi:quercetin dioxygenase-like cupin family protein